MLFSWLYKATVTCDACKRTHVLTRCPKCKRRVHQINPNQKEQRCPKCNTVFHKDGQLLCGNSLDDGKCQQHIPLPKFHHWWLRRWIQALAVLALFMAWAVPAMVQTRDTHIARIELYNDVGKFLISKEVLSTAHKALYAARPYLPNGDLMYGVFIERLDNIESNAKFSNLDGEKSYYEFLQSIEGEVETYILYSPCGSSHYSSEDDSPEAQANRACREEWYREKTPAHIIDLIADGLGQVREIWHQIYSVEGVDEVHELRLQFEVEKAVFTRRAEALRWYVQDHPYYRTGAATVAPYTGQDK